MKDVNVQNPKFTLNIYHSLDVVKFLKLFTEIPITEINKLGRLKGAEINEAKIVLANEVTKLCRSPEAAKKITISASNVFNKIKADEANKNPISIRSVAQPYVRCCLCSKPSCHQPCYQA